MTLRPSAAHIWTHCPAYPAMAANVPAEPPGDPAREGTCAAWVAEEVLAGKYPDAASMVGESHENGWVVEPDMAHHIDKYINLLRGYGGDVRVERSVRLTEDIEGTPDGYAVVSGTRLYVDDLKYGYIAVDPYRNPQVSIYAAAILLQNPGVSYVRIGIYQPRASHPDGIYRTWETTPSELWQFVNGIIAAGQATKDPNAPCIPGSHCHYCEAAATCATLAQSIYASYERIGREKQRHLTAEEAVTELEFLEKAEDMLAGRKRALRAEVTARMSGGEHFRGWYMEQGVGHRKWTMDKDTIFAFTGIDPTDGRLCTPAELERRGANPDVVEKMTHLPRTKRTLKPVPPGYYKKLFKLGD